MKILGILASVVLAVLPGVAQEKVSKIKVEVGGDKSLEPQITSGINQRLGQVRDVQIVTENPDFVIRVIVVQGKDLNDTSLGYVASLVLTKPVGSFEKSQLTQTLNSPALQKHYEEELPNYERWLMHILFRESKLDSLIDRVVASLPKGGS